MPRVCADSLEEYALPRPHSLVIETREVDGRWAIYTGENAVVRTNSSSSSANDLAILDAEEPVLVACPEDNAARQSGPEVLSQTLDLARNERPNLGVEGPSSFEYIDQHRDCLLISHHSQQFGSPWLARYDRYDFFDLDLVDEIRESSRPDLGHSQQPEEFPNNWHARLMIGESFTPHYWGHQSPFSQLQRAVLATPTRSSHFEIHSLQYTGADDGQEIALNVLSQPSQMSLVHSLLEYATKILTSNSMSDEVQRLPDHDDVLDSLLSLLPRITQEDGPEELGGIATKSNFESQFHTALLYSMANGFAGLRNIPSGAILRMLKKQHDMSSRIIDCLRSCPAAQAKCLAENLFRAAIQACDEEVVILILQATRDSPNAISPNEIVCQLDNKGRFYTPVELAAKFRHLGIVKILLAANADVNKTYEQNVTQERGALELAVRRWGKFEAVDINLVRTILHCHGEVRIGLVGAAIRWGQADLIHEFISRFPPASHNKFFEQQLNSHYVSLVETAEYLQNDIATCVIKRVFDYCQSEKCMRCSIDNQSLMETTLCTAAKRANFKLVELLLPHTAMKDGGLAAAIRSGSRKVIDLFFLHGASVGGPSCHLAEPSKIHQDLQLCPTTPLAEAIRSQDKDLVHEIEKWGALFYLDQKNHFEAALCAAAEIGDCYYIRKLLQLAPKKRGRDFTLALLMAIDKDRTEAALLLLHNGADVNSRGEYSRYTSVLFEAVRKQNRAVVDVILEANANVNLNRWYRNILEPAVLWGDMSIVEDLILMGADVNAVNHTIALTAAVKSRRKEMVKLLLESGASPDARIYVRGSPLTAAVENEDDDMIQLLISSGAELADENAFLSAIEQNRKIFNRILSAFSSRYPNGKRGFGGILLITAVERDDALLLNRMLAAKFDVNSFITKDYKSRLNALGSVLDTLSDSALGFTVDSASALGSAIWCGKRADEQLPLVRELLNHCDPNSIVFRGHSYRREMSLHQKTALLVAIETRSEHMVKLLLERGADVHRPARRGLKRTPLQLACEIGSFKIVKLLLEEHKANVNEEPASWDGATALQLAAISGSIKIAELLLMHGALVHAAPAEVGGRTALEGAAEHGCVEMIRVLWDAVAGDFTHEQIEKAKNGALTKGHRGCAEYIDSLLPATRFPLLDMDALIGSEM